MNELSQKAKNKQIKQSLLETSAKRKNQVCKVYELKLQNDRFSKDQKESLKMLFVEAKWLYNDILNFSNNSENKPWEYKIGKHVKHLDKQGNQVESEFNFLGSQMKQSVHEGLNASIRMLSTRKKRGYKIGKLKFKSSYDSINLKQFNHTYKFKGSQVKIQGVPGFIKINGLKQIPKEAEFANAKLLNKSTGYFLKVTTFIDKGFEKKQFKGEEIGVDLGISTAVTLSNGLKFNATVEESERLKRLQRQMFRRQKGSNNRRKTINKIRVEYEKLTNKKNDLANKIVHEIRQFKDIYMQDENLKDWQKGWFGRQVQHSVLGRVKAKLINDAYVLDRFVPTTKACYNCGQVYVNLTLTDRVFKCDCGIQEDRDIKAAKSMIVFAKMNMKLKSVPMERRDLLAETSKKKSVEIGTSVATNLLVVVSSDRRSRKAIIHQEDATSLA